MDNNTVWLLELIQACPELPVIPMVRAEVVLDDFPVYWRGSIGACATDHYVIGFDRIHFWDPDDMTEIEQALRDCGRYREGMSDDWMKDAYILLKWRKCIVVLIEPPED